jgi:hypothetical protein
VSPLLTKLLTGQQKALLSHLVSRAAGAEDEIRTRDPHLGKVMLYH